MSATLPLAAPALPESPSSGAGPVRFHLSLNVSDLSRSVAFYRLLFRVEPAKLRSDYAKFELDDPPVVLSLEPNGRPGAGPLNHLGFRMPSAAGLVAMQERLERGDALAARGGRRVLLCEADQVLGLRPRPHAVGGLHFRRRPRTPRRRPGARARAARRSVRSE